MKGKTSARALWSLTDQVLVSARNFLLLLVIIRTSTPEKVGVFGIVYATYFLALALVRGFGGDTLVVRASGTVGEDYDDAVSHSAGAAVGLSLLFGIVLFVAGLAIGGPLGTELGVMGSLLVPLLLQDHLRIALFAGLRPRSAAANDAVVLGVQAFGTAALLLGTSHATVVTMLLAWGAGAAVGVAMGLLQLRIRPAVLMTWQWIRTHRDLGPAFATDALANRGAEQLVNVGIGILAGLSAVGALTAARTLYAPLTTIQTGVNTFLMPEVARRNRAGDSVTVARLVPVMAFAMGAFMFVMGLLLWLVPTAWGEVVFGSNWGLARPVVIPMAAFSATNAVSFGYWAGLKALGRGRTVLLIRAVGGVALVLAANSGAVLGGAVGGAWGLTVATAGTAFWLAWAFHRAPRAGERGSPDPPGSISKVSQCSQPLADP